MDNFQIETVQNVSITQQTAGIGDRILAYLIDSMIIGGYAFLIMFVLIALSVDLESMWVIYLVAFLPILLYHALFEILMNGQTPGKHSMKIRVVKLDGSNPDFVSYVIRWILRIVDISLTSGGLAVFIILFRGKGQRVGDIAAGTTVITEKTKIGLVNTLLVDIPDNYVPKYPEVTIFSDGEMQTIKELYREARLSGQHQLLLRLSERISKVMKISPEERPMDFIDKVIKDYNYYTQKI